MRILKGLEASFLQASVATIGNFDGVHLGHKALIKGLKAKAMRLKLPLVVITFMPSPKRYFSKDKTQFSLSSVSDKYQHLCALGVDYLLCLRFNQSLSQMPADCFMTKLKKAINPKFLSVGDDFRFGYKRQGDVSALKMFFKTSCQVETLAEIKKDNQRISSTSIRQAIKDNDLDLANRLLGHPYSITGRVCFGKQHGREIGVPTANVMQNQQKTPLTGIFCVAVIVNDKRYLGVANLGYRPMVDGVNYGCEVHLFDFNQMIYGQRVQVLFLKKLREEEKYTTMDALILQIKKDIQISKEYFRENRLES